MPNRMRAAPRITRSQDAHVGGDLCRPPSTPEAATESAVRAPRPSTQPARKARPLGLGLGACNTSTAGITVIGESAMTSPSGISAPSTEPQLSATGSNLPIVTAVVPRKRAAGSSEAGSLQSANSVVDNDQADH